MYRIRCPLRYITFLPISVNFQFSRIHLQMLVATSTLSNSFRLYCRTTSSLSIAAILLMRTEHRISVPHKQHLLSRNFHFIQFVKDWPTVSPSVFTSVDSDDKATFIRSTLSCLDIIWAKWFQVFSTSPKVKKLYSTIEKMDNSWFAKQRSSTRHQGNSNSSHSYKYALVDSVPLWSDSCQKKECDGTSCSRSTCCLKESVWVLLKDRTFTCSCNAKLHWALLPNPLGVFPNA